MGLFSSAKGGKRNKNRSFEKKMLTPKKVAKVKRRTGKETLGKGFSFFLLFLWMLLFGTAAYVLFFSPSLSIASISVSGGDTETQKRMENFLEERISGKYLSLLPRGNFFLVRKGSLEDTLLATFPLLRSAKLERKFPDRLLLHIELRKKVVLWCSGGPCYIVTEEGNAKESQAVFSSEENMKDTLMVIDKSGQPVRLGQRLFDFDFATFVVELRPHFEDRLGIRLTNEYAASSRFADTLEVRTEEGFLVYLNTRLPLEESLDILSLLFEKEINEEQRKKLRYIDLRTQNRVFYAFQEGDEQEGNKDEDKEKKEEEQKKDEDSKKKKP